jgi:hypothetical protein
VRVSERESGSETGGEEDERGRSTERSEGDQADPSRRATAPSN